MIFKIAPEIIRDYPGLTIGVVVAHDITNKPSNEQVQALLHKIQEEIKAGLTQEQLAQHPHIVAWLEAYKKFGSNPKKYIPSVKNLADRVLKKGSIPSINTLVDLYNVISLKYLLPAGGEDLMTIDGNIELAVAGNNEVPALLLGDKQASTPEPGEIFYKDSQGAICRRWNWREADRTKLTIDTKNAFLVLEALQPVEGHLVQDAVNELALLIEKYCGGIVSVAILNAQHPELTIKRVNAYIKHHAPKPPKEHAAQDIYSKTSIESAVVADSSKEHRVRLEKVETMRADGLEPWPANKEVTADSQTVKDEFDETKESRTYEVAGRLMTFREHGKTAFAHIQDPKGRLQIYIRQDEIGQDAFDKFKNFVDVGDIVWFAGPSFKTKTGEITIKARELSLISKCLHPLPEKFHGLTDVETSYRQRYLDLISNPESRERFNKRSLIVRTIRNFLDAHGFMEVETPMLHTIPGGAAARPFVTHHNTLDMDLYLRIAPELYLKRLVVGGFDRVYEINRNFRNEGVSTKHNPEFTMLEFYVAYKDYHFAMDFVEQLLRKAADEVAHSLYLPFGKHILDFAAPFTRLTMRDAVKQYGKLSDEDLSDEGIDAVLKKHHVKIDNKEAVWGHKLYALFETFVEPHLVQPTFITEFPIEVSPLAKRDPNNPNIAARFELFIAGVELSNGFNELNDPIDQAQRFKEQADARTAGDTEAHYYDAEFVQALEYGLPPTAGVGIGIDRLTMFLTNATSIKDIILFPTLKKR